MALSLCPGGLPRGEAVPKGLKGYFNMDKTKSIPHPNNPSYPVLVRNKEALSF
jgi:hypothetical protein